MARVFFFLLAVAIVLAGVMVLYRFATDPDFRPDKEAEFNPTRDEVLAELRPTIGLLSASVHAPPEQRPGFPLEIRDQVINGLRDAQMKYGETEGGQAAFKVLAEEVKSLALEARKQERWRVVATCVDAHDILGMSSLVMQRLDDRARKILAQPMVRVRGVVDDLEQGTTYILMELINRETFEVTRTRARVGDILGDLRVVELVGRNNKVIFEYLPIEGLTFEVDFS